MKTKKVISLVCYSLVGLSVFSGSVLLTNAKDFDKVYAVTTKINSKDLDLDSKMRILISEQESVKNMGNHIEELHKKREELNTQISELNLSIDDKKKSVEKLNKEKEDLIEKTTKLKKEKEAREKAEKEAREEAERLAKQQATQTTQNSSTQTSSATPTEDNWHRANRRKVESGDNYKWEWGNGYYGAYQFAPGTWNSIASSIGADPNDHSKENQDRMADAYALQRYDGWFSGKVPTSGGW